MELVATIAKNEDAEIRVEVGDYRGRLVVNVRVWFEPRQGGARIPSKKGIAFDFAKLPDVIAGLQEAARRLGLPVIANPSHERNG